MFPSKLYFFSDFNYNYMDIPRTTSAKILLLITEWNAGQATNTCEITMKNCAKNSR